MSVLLTAMLFIHSCITGCTYVVERMEKNLGRIPSSVSEGKAGPAQWLSSSSSLTFEAFLLFKLPLRPGKCWILVCRCPCSSLFHILLPSVGRTVGCGAVLLVSGQLGGEERERKGGPYGPEEKEEQERTLFFHILSEKKESKSWWELWTQKRREMFFQLCRAKKGGRDCALQYTSTHPKKMEEEKIIHNARSGVCITMQERARGSSIRFRVGILVALPSCPALSCLRPVIINPGGYSLFHLGGLSFPLLRPE